MKPLLVPSVSQGPLSAAEEDQIWAGVMGFGGPAPPLSGWLIASMSIWADKREISRQIASKFGVSEKTLMSGLPKREAKLRRSVENFDRFIGDSLKRTKPQLIVKRKRAIDRAVQLFATEPEASTLFNQALGFLGGDELELFSVATDKISTEILQNRVSRKYASPLIVSTAEQTQVVPVGAIDARNGIDPGLDALLALTARLDRDWSVKFLADEKRISSVFGLLVDMPGGERKRPAAQRLLDLYYALAYAMKHKKLPAKLASIRELEDHLLGSPPASGGQSFIVRWRNGSKKLRFEDIEQMSAHIAKSTGYDLDLDFKILWSVCKLWALIEAGGSAAVLIAGARYHQWWNAMIDPGRVASPLISPYFVSFQPHA